MKNDDQVKHFNYKKYLTDTTHSFLHLTGWKYCQHL